MVIQRWQSVLLLLAVVAMVAFCATPFAFISDMAGEASLTPVYLLDMPVYLVLNIVIAVLLFLSIFMYKNLNRQMKVTCVNIVLITASIITGAIELLYTLPDATPVLCGGILLPLISLVLAAVAYRFMKNDRRLLSSYDRLR